MVDRFKDCGCCTKRWTDRAACLADPELVLEGYQVDFAHPESGFLLFTHSATGCGTTLALEVELFADLVPPTQHDQNLHGSLECPGRCGRSEDLRRRMDGARTRYASELSPTPNHARQAA